MDILVIGSGGREHAIVKKLRESRRAGKIYCAPGNAGISFSAECVPIKATDIRGVCQFAKEKSIDLVFIAPDDPLVMGMADALQAEGIRVFGPSKAAARIEGSKSFSKDLMKRYSIPTADYRVFTDISQAISYIDRATTYPVVIKADGLALGKGVTIAETREAADRALRESMEQLVFGESGRTVVIEEYLSGPEVSVLAFCDGKTIRPMVSSMDHKRVFDFDEGPNTGGMGTIAPNPFYTPEIAQQCMETIFLPTVRALQQEGCPFVGCLYFGLMLTREGPRVIEYNCRFGDPETQVVLPLLKTDFLDVIDACIDGTLEDLTIEWSDQTAVCVILASGGYPKKYTTGYPITGLDERGERQKSLVFHAGTKLCERSFKTAGGRVLGVTALGNSLEEAIGLAYEEAREIHFQDRHMRNDIGRKSFAGF